MDTLGIVETKDINFMQNWNKGMEEHFVTFRNGNKVELM